MWKIAESSRGDEKPLTDLKEWLTRKAEEDERLYQEYGRPLEKEHKGELVAIGPDGQTVLGPNVDEVFNKAMKSFGSGNFAFTRVGQRAVWKCLSLSV